MTHGTVPTSFPIPAPLLKAIASGNCVAFVGAGFSGAAKFPQWGALLEQIASDPSVDAPAAEDRVKSLVQRGSAHALDQAAQLLEDHLLRAGLVEALRTRLVKPPAQVPEAMQRRLAWLRGIPFRAVLTTNFDGLLVGDLPGPKAYRHVLRPRRHRWWDRRFWDERSSGARVVKLHGDLLREAGQEEVVLTRRDYRRRLYEAPGYNTFLRSLFGTTTILYLGASFSDAYLNELRSEMLALVRYAGRERPLAYALVADAQEAECRHFRAHEGIEVVSFDTKGNTDFSGFDRFLESLHEHANPVHRLGRLLEGRRLLWLDPRPENNFVALRDVRRAAAVAGRAPCEVVQVASPEEALGQLEAARSKRPFDLLITHWGAGKGPVPAGERLLVGLRSRDLRVPVIVFSGREDVEERTRRARALGAQAYCHTFEALLRRLRDVLKSSGAPGHLGSGAQPSASSKNSLAVPSTRRARDDGSRGEAPVLAIADLHGNLGLFERALEEGKRRAGRDDLTVVTLGDYCDNGLEIRDLIERLSTFGAEHPGKFLPILGNHDLACLLALGRQDAASGDEAWWERWNRRYTNGHEVRTATQYGAKTLVEFREKFEPSHWRFLADLPWARRVGDYVFVHAGLEKGPIEPQLAELEGRDLSAYGALQQPPAVRDKKRARVFDPTWSAVVVSGHTKHADKKDFVAPNRICLHSATCELQPLHAVLLPARAHLGANPTGDFFQVGWDS